MNKFLLYAFIATVGLFIFNKEHPEKFDTFVTQPAIYLKTKIVNFSYAEKKAQFNEERLKIIDTYSGLLGKYQPALSDLEKEKKELSIIANPDLTISEKIEKINEKIIEKKEEYLAKKIEIEEQISDLEKRYNDVKDSIEDFQNSIQKIKDGIRDSQDSIDSFSEAVTS